MFTRRHSFRATDSSTSLPLASRVTANAPIIDLTPVPHGSGVVAHPTIGHDLACGIMAGVIDAPSIFVTPDAISVVVPGSQSTRPVTGWLKPDDPLGRLAAECFQARQKMMNTPPSRKPMPWERAKEIRERETASGAFRSARQRVFDLLKTRGVLGEAERRGYRVIVDG